MTNESGDGDTPASPTPKVGPSLRCVPCCLLEDPVEQSPRGSQQVLFIGTSSTGFFPIALLVLPGITAT